jgi:hypothetical protein
MAWDFSLGNIGASIADVLKSNNETKAQTALANAQIAAAAGQDTRAMSIAQMNQGQVQFITVAVVVAVIGIALLRRA